MASPFGFSEDEEVRRRFEATPPRCPNPAWGGSPLAAAAGVGLLQRSNERLGPNTKRINKNRSARLE